MYINDIHIMIYILFGIIGLLVGIFINLCNIKLVEHKQIFTKTIFNDIKLIKPNYILMLINSALYMGILYRIELENPIMLIGFLVLVPMLISAFYIDYKMQIIPNRLTLTIFEVGLVFTFLQGLSDINIALEMLIGFFVGAGIFLLITLLGGLFFGKETMGFGDVKLMGALGLFFGWRSIIAISILSFFIGAIFSVGILIYSKIKKQETTEFIAFGPFIVTAAIIVLFIPLDVFIILLFKIFTLGKYNI